MLADHPIVPILRTRDVARSRAFYHGKLGLREATRAPHHASTVSFEGGGQTRLSVELSTAVPVPADEDAVVAFDVEDVEAEVADLKSRGVTFDAYDITMGDGDEPLGRLCAAWFHDPDGNVLCVRQRAHRESKSRARRHSSGIFASY